MLVTNFLKIDWTVETLERVISEDILLETHIVSNGWTAYANLETIEDGIYRHFVVMHEGIW